MKYFKKSLNLLFFLLDKIYKNGYIKLYPKYLHWLGININPDKCEGTWISPTVFFDSSKYDYLTIGERVTISFDVAVLVHDYSIVHAARSIGKKVNSIIYKPVSIGNNVFVGARSIIMPGTTIPDNCIIGGGTVVKGKLESNSIYVGNPCRKIGTTDEFAGRYDSLLVNYYEG